jgi:multicomponent Na+:H+ antiporter subunit F
VLLEITMGFLIAGVFITSIRMIKGPTVWDRLLSLNLISAKVVMLLSVYGVYKNNVLLLDISISYSIIGFLCITLLCKFIFQGGRLK